MSELSKLPEGLLNLMDFAASKKERTEASLATPIYLKSNQINKIKNTLENGRATALFLLSSKKINEARVVNQITSMTTAITMLQGLLEQGEAQPEQETESVLIDGIAHTVPMSVACELLRLNMLLVTYRQDATRYQWLTSREADGRNVPAGKAREMVYKVWNLLTDEQDEMPSKGKIDAAIDSVIQGEQVNAV